MPASARHAQSHLRVSFSNTAALQLVQAPDDYQLPSTSTLNLNNYLPFFFLSSTSEIQTTAKINLLLIEIHRPPFLQSRRIIAQTRFFSGHAQHHSTQLQDALHLINQAPAQVLED